MILAPLSTKSREASYPIPVFAPVIRIVFPFREIFFLISPLTTVGSPTRQSICHKNRELNRLKYHSGSDSGSRNFIFNGSVPGLFKNLGSVRVQLHQNLQVRVWFSFNDLKFKQFRFGSGSPKKKSGFYWFAVQVRFDSLCFRLIKF